MALFRTNCQRYRSPIYTQSLSRGIVALTSIVTWRSPTGSADCATVTDFPFSRITVRLWRICVRRSVPAAGCVTPLTRGAARQVVLETHANAERFPSAISSGRYRHSAARRRGSCSWPVDRMRAAPAIAGDHTDEVFFSAADAGMLIGDRDVNLHVDRLKLTPRRRRRCRCRGRGRGGGGRLFPRRAALASASRRVVGPAAAAQRLTPRPPSCRCRTEEHELSSLSPLWLVNLRRSEWRHVYRLDRLERGDADRDRPAARAARRIDSTLRVPARGASTSDGATRGARCQPGIGRKLRSSRPVMFGCQPDWRRGLSRL